jgi:translation elongation factor EF-G
VPKEYIPGVEKGIKSVMDSGPLAGFPVIDFKVALSTASSTTWTPASGLRNRGPRCACAKGSRRPAMKLLEPIMKVEVVTPEEYTGGIIGDLTSRRGQVRDQEPRGNAIAINAFVPLANMFGYINTLRSMSLGPRAVHDAVRPLRAGAAEHLRRDPGEIRVIWIDALSTNLKRSACPKKRRPPWQRQSLNVTSRM